MVLKSSNKNDKTRQSVVSPVETSIDNNDYSLRPQTIADYVWQKTLKKHLDVSIKSSLIRKEPLSHILFYGPPGLGKTTISNIVANELWVKLRITSWPAIEKQADIVSILSNVEENDVLFIDEIHRLKPQIEEILYTAMEDFNIDIMIGKWAWAQSVRIPIPPFTLLGATTKLSKLSSPLRDRFGNVLKLDFYDEDDICKILSRNSKILNIWLDKNIILDIAKRSRGTPRIANRLLKIIRDYHTIGKEVNDEKILFEVFSDIHIDSLGLDMLDKKFLDMLHYKFNGWPVGLNTLASAIWEEESTIEDVVEPYLLQIWFLERSPRGRKITDVWVRHLLDN